MTQSRLSKYPASIQVFVQALVNWWDDWVGQVVLGILWVFAWMTVILGPPVTFGLCYVESRLVRGESLGFRGLVEGVKKYFFKSWLWALANVAVIFLTINGALFYGMVEAWWGAALRILMLSILISWVVVQFFAVPFLMIQEDESLRLAWRNGLFTVLASPGFTLVLLFFTIVFIGLSVVFVVPLFLGFISLTTILFTQAVRERVATFRAIVQKDAEKDQDETD